MKLLQKLHTIAYPKIAPLQAGKALTVEEFWDSFIVHTLPEKEIALKWHRTLMEYVKHPDAMFAIRGYNTATKDNYDSLRRGFLTKTDVGYSFFYTDNFHAAYYVKMARDGYVPTVSEMIAVYNSRKFPARFGRDTSNERAMMAIPKGVDPGIQAAGYKIAHILNVGKDYIVRDRNCSLSQIIQKYFSGGQRSDWIWHTDTTGSYFLRNVKVDPEARRFLIAEFLRFVHPFNYFLAPKTTCSVSSIAKDIAEYKPIINYVQHKYAAMYGDAYSEFLSLVMTESPLTASVRKNAMINLKYGMNCHETPIAQTALKKTVKPSAPQSQNSAFEGIPAHITQNLEIRIVAEYLTNPQTSFRKLEHQFMGIDSPDRGGGFIAKKIVNSYGVVATMKGVLARTSIEDLIQAHDGKCQNALMLIKELLEKKK